MLDRIVAQLRAENLVVELAVAQQVLVPALGRDPAVVQHQDQVRIADGADPLGDDEHGALARPNEPVERVADGRLGFGVDRRGAVVQDQQARIDQQGARDRQSLALATRQADAALADERLVPQGQFSDERVRLGGARRGLDLGRRRVGLAVGDVVAHAPAEQERLLQHDADLAAGSRPFAPAGPRS